MQIADFTEVADQTFGDWQRDYLYQLMVTKEPIAADFATNKGDIDKNSLDAYCDAFPLPNSKQNSIKRMWAGKWFMGSSKLDSANTVSLTFRFDEHNKLYQYLNAWHQLSGSDQHAASVPKYEYIGDIALVLYKSDKTSIGKGWTLKNAWIAELSDLNLDKTKDGYLTFTVSIAYDKKVAYTPA